MLMFEGSGFRQVREMHFYLEILRSSILISTYNKLYTSKIFLQYFMLFNPTENLPLLVCRNCPSLRSSKLP